MSKHIPHSTQCFINHMVFKTTTHYYHWSKSQITLWRPTEKGDFQKTTPKRMWLCVGISPVR